MGKLFKRYFFDGKLIRFFFYIFPLILLRESGYITAYVIFISLIFIAYMYFTNKKILLFPTDYVLIIYFIISIFSTLINLNNNDFIIIIKSISNLRFALLFIIVRNLINQKIVCLKTALIFVAISTIILSIDIFWQHIFGKDIFGYPPDSYGRFNGLFDDEAIAGSYLQKFFLLSLASIFIFNINENKKKIFIFILINLIGSGILLSLDRMPFLIFIFQLVLLVVFLRKYRLFFFLNLVFYIVLVIYFSSNYKIIQKRMNSFSNEINIIKIIDRTKIYKFTNPENIIENYEINKPIFLKRDLFYSNYIKIFNSAFLIATENLFIGSGIKSFYSQCIEYYKKNNKILLCSTHPHNLYLETLINSGILGMTILILFISLLFINLFKLVIKKNYNIYSIFLILLIAELIPIRSYGSIIQTVNGTMFWYLISFATTILPKNKGTNPL